MDAAAVTDALSEGLIHLGARSVVDYANAAAHVLLDRRPGTLAGQSAVAAFLDHRVEELIATAQRRGSAVAELTPRTVDGRALVVRARQAGVGVWLVVEDVTELRRLQRIRAEFIDNLSHELRTPVTNLSLLAESLARDAGDLEPRVRERVARIEVEAGHLAQMVSELLDLATIEAGQQLRIDDVDLAQVARSQVERLRPFAERQGVSFVLEAPDPAVVRGDAERLGQALLNLLHNAVKFSAPGGAVTVVVETGPDTVTLSVVDEGIGIARADLGRIFERFYKADRARRRGQGGTGLGLAIARHVVEAHGGTVTVESEQGVGSTFRVVIPRAGAAGLPADRGRSETGDAAMGAPS